MNKIRLIKIYELRGKVHPIEQYIIDILDGIGEFPIGDCIYYKKDSEVYFYHYLNNNNIWMYSIFYKNFGSSIEETKEVIKYLLEKHLKLTINEIY